MATKHWARDANITDPVNNISNGNQVMKNALVYHYLRNAGMKWIWECDGEVGPRDADCNHVDDGSMEEFGIAKWPAVATATVTKSTATVKTGSQSLSIVSAAPGDGASSVVLRDMLRAGQGNLAPLVSPDTRMVETVGRWSLGYRPGMTITITGATNPGNNGTFAVTSVVSNSSSSEVHWNNAAAVLENNVKWATNEPYELFFWSNNPGTSTWDVKVDQGGGAPVTIGTIPPNGGVWTQYHFSFSPVPGEDGTNPRYLSFIEPALGGGEQIFVDGLHVFHSHFEYWSANQYGTDGIVTNPDTFSTGGSYAPGAADIGKWLLIWDVANPLNSGWYKITVDLGGGSVQVDLRSPTAAFITTPGLNYRIVDIEGQWYNYDYEYGRNASGFALESPHSSAWRFFMRNANPAGQTSKGTILWGAPEDTDFDVDDGQFYNTGPSTGSRIDTGPYDFPVSTTLQLVTRGPYTYKATPTLTRTFLMTDEDLSFFTVFHWDDDGGDHGYYFAGYTGADPNRPGTMEWMIAAGYTTGFNIQNETLFNGTVGSFSGSGTGISSSGIGVEATFGCDLGYDSSLHSFEQANAGQNPWSGNEWLQKPIVAIDPDGIVGAAAEGDADCGIYKTRYNLTELTTFESDMYLSCDTGLVWEWSGEQLAP